MDINYIRTLNEKELKRLFFKEYNYNLILENNFLIFKCYINRALDNSNKENLIKDYLENSDDILARIIQHPTCTNARIFDDSVEVDITFEILAEIIGETKMKVTVFREENTWEDDVEVLDMDLNENFLEN